VKWPGDASRFAEPHGLLLARFALGVYLGKGRGEIELYYNHRHDTFAGGIQFQVSGDGPAGFAGVRARYSLTSWLGLFGDVAIGNNFTAFMGVTLSGPKVQP